MRLFKLTSVLSLYSRMLKKKKNASHRLTSGFLLLLIVHYHHLHDLAEALEEGPEIGLGDIARQPT